MTDAQTPDIRKALRDALDGKPGWRQVARAALGLPAAIGRGRRVVRDHNCEGCGAVVIGIGLPDGWISTGWSVSLSRGAEWCAECEANGTMQRQSRGRREAQRMNR